MLIIIVAVGVKTCLFLLSSYPLLLCPLCRPLARDGLETGPDGLHRASRVTRHALQKEQSRLLVEDGVGGAAGVAGHVLLDVPPEYVLHVLLLEAALDDQLVVAVNRANRAQLGGEEGEEVFRLAMEPNHAKKKIN
jgi:hypothetical protein